MYIVVIAWLYVVVLMAATEPSWVGATLTVAFYGLLPLAILLYLYGTPERRRRAARPRSGLADQPVGEPDGTHPEQDQADLPGRR